MTEQGEELGSNSDAPPARAGVDVLAGISDAQLKEAREVFSLFDVDVKGEIGHKEMVFAMARLGMNPGPDEVDAMIAEFDVDGGGTIDFQEFVQMMQGLGWHDAMLSDDELARLKVSFYGQASICRWLQDGASKSGDVVGDDVGEITSWCRNVAMSRTYELLVYLCIFAAAVISGLQSYEVDSPYENATWAVTADVAILIIFTTEISKCRAQLHATAVIDWREQLTPGAASYENSGRGQ